MSVCGCIRQQYGISDKVTDLVWIVWQSESYLSSTTMKPTFIDVGVFEGMYLLVYLERFLNCKLFKNVSMSFWNIMSGLVMDTIH